ncbi:type II secretion system protein [Streptomyces caniscabiei]|uniref:type II secretion system protein n=1 Tax=Streptomyces caniscabiei TaxID=2746961 RepID=UPI0029A15FD6|nr:type II secretion system protein [Streptomyces caniscabiei]MDX2776302.1 type II secretion system protein [Streptomyces caniscabiei]
MNVQTNNQKGFTIIEVVLVLAIAGLIFLMVFIALPALQRSQRDTQRRDDVSRFVSQLTSYSTNNKGALPDDDTANGSFKQTYLKPSEGEFNDPSKGEPYTIVTGTPSEGQMQYVVGQECDGEGLKPASSTRQAAVRVQLESGGMFCQNAK